MEDLKMVEDLMFFVLFNIVYVSENSFVWLDFLVMIKIGIVNLNFIIIFIGFWLVFFFNE